MCFFIGRRMMKQFRFADCAEMLKAMANPKRLEILLLLKGREFNVSELEKLVDLSQSSLSQHLAVLRQAKMVKTRRKAQSIFYSLADGKIADVLLLLEKLYPKLYTY